MEIAAPAIALDMAAIVPLTLELVTPSASFPVEFKTAPVVSHPLLIGIKAPTVVSEPLLISIEAPTVRSNARIVAFGVGFS